MFPFDFQVLQAKYRRECLKLRAQFLASTKGIFTIGCLEFVLELGMSSLIV